MVLAGEFTEESGYGIVGSAVKDGQRLIVVIGGTKSDKERAEEARQLRPDEEP